MTAYDPDAETPAQTRAWPRTRNRTWTRTQTWARSWTRNWTKTCAAALFAGLTGLAAAPPASAADAVEPELVIVRAPIVVGEGEVFDGGGRTYSWDPEDPTNACSQREGQDEVFVLKRGATLRNLRIAYSPDGVKVEGDDVLVENVVWEKVCEDALVIGRRSAKRRWRPHNVIVRDSVFIGGEDKQIQINGGENLYFYRNRHEGGGAGVRVKDGVYGVYVWSTEFQGTKDAIRYDEDVHIGSGPIALTGRPGDFFDENTPSQRIYMTTPPALPFEADAR